MESFESLLKFVGTYKQVLKENETPSQSLEAFFKRGLSGTGTLSIFVGAAIGNFFTSLANFYGFIGGSLLHAFKGEGLASDMKTSFEQYKKLKYSFDFNRDQIIPSLVIILLLGIFTYILYKLCRTYVELQTSKKILCGCFVFLGLYWIFNKIRSILCPRRSVEINLCQFN